MRSGLDDKIAAAGGQRSDAFDVRDRTGYVGRRLIVSAECTGPSLSERPSAPRTEFFDQLLVQPIVPSPGELGDGGLEAADYRSLRRIGDETEMEARRVTLAEREVEIDQGAVERGGEGVLDAPAEFGGAGLARHHDQRDHVAVAQVGRHEQPHRGLALDVQDEAQLRAQFGDGRAKEFILGKAVERGNDFLVVVRARYRALILQHFAQLRAQHRDVLRFLGVRLRGEQPDEIVERDDPARSVGAANRDAVHWAAAMHVRFGASLADHQWRSFEKELAARGREFIERDRAAKSRLVVLPHDAEFGAWVEREFGGAVVAAHQITAKAEKYEAAVDEPAHQVADLDQFADRRGLVADLQRAAGHLLKVAGRFVDLGQDRDDIVLDLSRLLRPGCQLEFGVNE